MSSSSRFYRCPSSQNEKRANASVEDEQYIRTSRKARNLPDSYDDLPRSRGQNSKPRAKDRR